jgi:hypothetical protein
MSVAPSPPRSTRLLLDARTLALASTEAMLGDYPELTLHPLAKGSSRDSRAQRDRGDGHSRRGAGHPDVRSLGQSYVLPSGLKPIEDARRLARGETPARTEDACRGSRHPPRREVARAAVVGMPRTYLDRVIADARRKQIPVLAIFLGAAVLVPLVLVSQLLRPIATLRRGIERIGRGELDRPLVLRDRTELGLWQPPSIRWRAS